MEVVAQHTIVAPPHAITAALTPLGGSAQPGSMTRMVMVAVFDTAPKLSVAKQGMIPGDEKGCSTVTVTVNRGWPTGSCPDPGWGLTVVLNAGLAPEPLLHVNVTGSPSGSVTVISTSTDG